MSRDDWGVRTELPLYEETCLLEGARVYKTYTLSGGRPGPKITAIGVYLAAPAAKTPPRHGGGSRGVSKVCPPFYTTYLLFVLIRFALIRL
jgi:hypothetical protein